MIHHTKKAFQCRGTEKQLITLIGGTIGLFDSVYLPLRKGENTVLIAVSESFGGWLVTGKFEDESGIEIR